MLKHRPELWQRAGVVPSTLLVRRLPGIQKDHLVQHLSGCGATFGDPVGTIADRINVDSTKSELLALTLMQVGLVEYVEPDRLIPQAMIPNDPHNFFEVPSAQYMFGAWGISRGGSSSFSVAVLDTGCDTAHEDLQVNILPGWNVLNSSTDVTDNDSHGTHTCSVVGATTNNGIGIPAFGWATKTIPVKIVNTGAATTGNMAAGLDWVRLNTNARVASISYAPTGGWGFSDSTLNTAINNCWDANILCFFASGEGGSFVSSPTGNPYAQQVGGTNGLNVFQSGFSNYGPGINFYTAALADCCDSFSSSGNETTYTQLAGTSASTPIAASIAALMLAVNPGLSQQEIANLMNNPNLGRVVTNLPDSSSPIALDASRLVYVAANPPPMMGSNQN